MTLSGCLYLKVPMGIQSIKIPHLIMGMISAWVWKPSALPLRILSLYILDKYERLTESRIKIQMKACVSPGVLLAPTQTLPFS